MKTFYLTFFLMLFFLTNLQQVSAQDKTKEIVIKNSTIVYPDVHDYGEIEENTRVVDKYIIINERESSVEIKNIKTPSGYMANISKSIINPSKKITLHLIIDSSWIDKKGDFIEKIIIKTNLVKDIVIEVRGTYK